MTCPHCTAKEPSVWDDVLSHFAHPHVDGTKLKFCHDPWRDRCRGCSSDVADGDRFCASCTRHLEQP